MSTMLGLSAAWVVLETKPSATEATKCRKRFMPDSIVRQKRGGNSVAASASADCGLTAGCLDAAAVNVPLHHGTPPAVADIELGDFFVVLGLGDLAALKRGGVFPELRLVGRFKLAQFAIRGGAAGEEQAGEEQQDKIENRFHVARRVRVANLVVKQSCSLANALN